MCNKDTTYIAYKSDNSTTELKFFIFKLQLSIISNISCKIQDFQLLLGVDQQVGLWSLVARYQTRTRMGHWNTDVIHQTRCLDLSHLCHVMSCLSHFQKQGILRQEEVLFKGILFSSQSQIKRSEWYVGSDNSALKNHLKKPFFFPV